MWLRSRSGGLFAAGAVVLGLWPGPAARADSLLADTREAGGALPVVEVRDGLVSVRASGAPLAEVLTALAQAFGIALTLRGDLSEPVVQAFGPVPLGEGIRRLVGSHTLMMIEVAASDASGVTPVTHLSVTGPRAAAGGERGFDDPDGRARGLEIANPAHRIRALERLAESGSPDAAPLAGDVLAADTDPRVRIAAAAALTRIGGDAAVAHLERGLGDRDPTVQAAVLRALGQVGGEQALLLLGQVVHGGAEPRARLAAVRALADVGSEPATAMLNAAARDSDERVRAAARHALYRKR